MTITLDPAMSLFLERVAATCRPTVCVTGAACDRNEYGECCDCGQPEYDADELEALADMARVALASGVMPLPPPAEPDPTRVPPRPKRKRMYRSTEQGRALVRRAIQNVRADRESLAKHEQGGREWAAKARHGTLRAAEASLRYLLKNEVWQ
jgi:hypothetical protein